MTTEHKPHSAQHAIAAIRKNLTAQRRGDLLVHLDSLEEQFDALRHAAGDFVTAYRAASMSDEEGLLMAIDPDAMRQLWHRVDEAATDVEQAL